MKRSTLLVTCGLMFVGGALVAVGFAFWIRGGPPDWLGFAGSIIGGLFTLFAGALAWFSAQESIRQQNEQIKTIKLDEFRRAYNTILNIYSNILRVDGVIQLNLQVFDRRSGDERIDPFEIMPLPVVIEGYMDLFYFGSEVVIAVSSIDAQVTTVNMAIDNMRIMQNYATSKGTHITKTREVYELIKRHCEKAQEVVKAEADRVHSLTSS